MFRQITEFFHERTDFVLFTGIGNIGNIHQNGNAFALLFMKTAYIEYFVPIAIRKGEARRIVGRRIEHDQDRILFL